MYSLSRVFKTSKAHTQHLHNLCPPINIICTMSYAHPPVALNSNHCLVRRFSVSPALYTKHLYIFTWSPFLLVLYTLWRALTSPKFHCTLMPQKLHCSSAIKLNSGNCAPQFFYSCAENGTINIWCLNHICGVRGDIAFPFIVFYIGRVCVEMGIH